MSILELYLLIYWLFTDLLIYWLLIITDYLLI